VLIVAALGWLFDTMDQQLFNLARVPAMTELLAPSPGVAPPPGSVERFGGITTAIFLIGWATGGLLFGVLGDRIGRAKTMMLTILVYSLCTGLSALSRNVWDFSLYRFLTGLGVGGEFAVGVALVAEAMPPRSRPFALGLLQALSAVGNIGAALISIGLGHLEQAGVLGQYDLFGITVTAWRAMFLVGALPALLALVIRRRLKEPQRWQAAAHGSDGVRLGSYAELFGDPRWRKRAIVGLLLATSGVIGVWGIGFFSIDLNRSVFRKVFAEEARATGEAEHDRQFLQLLVANPELIDTAVDRVRLDALLSPSAANTDAPAIYEAILELHRRSQAVSAEAILAELDARGQGAEERTRRAAYLTGSDSGATATPSVSDAQAAASQHIERISARQRETAGRLTRWAGYTSMMLNVGAFFGIYGFGLLTQRIGRRPAFALAFVAAGLSTALVFWKLNDVTDVFWMMPLMGFCLLSLFGGYAIYFPELFPTRLRSTGTSFCYNVGRFAAALGPFTLGTLTSGVFQHYDEPMRYAGMTMCLVFVIGLAALPFAPETRNQPLPE
jgi:MFS family permease